MKEHPLLYSAPMVRAKLAGTKTQTRRIIAAANSLVDGSGMRSIEHLDLSKAWVDKGPSPAGNPGPYLKVPTLDGDTTHRLYPRYQVGDRIWGRETTIISPKRWTRDWALIDKESRREDDDGDIRAVQYLANGPDREAADGFGLKATPSIFMPRWASRILDEVVSVRPERLQDISEADAVAEGLEARVGTQIDGWYWPGSEELFTSARAAYLAGWDTINAKKAPAKSNPWVWRIETRPA